jgi:hypothetical protein
MADYCFQCTEKFIGVSGDNNDLKGITPEKEAKRGLYNVELCEGCGAIQVDHEGRCVSSDCYENGHKKER